MKISLKSKNLATTVFEWQQQKLPDEEIIAYNEGLYVRYAVSIEDGGSAYYRKAEVLVPPKPLSVEFK